jgi:hypothetical protein
VIGVQPSADRAHVGGPRTTLWSDALRPRYGTPRSGPGPYSPVEEDRVIQMEWYSALMLRRLAAQPPGM